MESCRIDPLLYARKLPQHAQLRERDGKVLNIDLRRCKLTQPDDAFVAVCPLQDLPESSSKAVTVDGQSILLCRTQDQVFAVENRCTHQNTPLAGGRVRGGYVSCPLHGVRFNLSTGEPMGTLTRIPLRTFAVRTEDGEIALKLQD